MQDDILAWIAEVRGRHACGDLDLLPPIKLGRGTGRLHAEPTVSVMLADLDLLDDFRRLRVLIG